MRTAATLIALFMAVATAMAQGVQDFASKFMDVCGDDTTVHCITISPKMMEQLTKQQDPGRKEHIAQALQKLKSARIVSASARGDEYFRMAEDLLKKNSKRFSHAGNYRDAHKHGTFYIRKTGTGDTVELIMLHADTKRGRLTIINLTGDIDNEFIENLTKDFGNGTAKAHRPRHDKKNFSKLSI